MSVITLYARRTQFDESLSPEMQQRMDIIQKQAKQASALIDQILDFSRGASLELLPLNLITFFKEAVRLLERTLPENIALHFTCPAEPLLANADPTRMQQVITNLAVNARDAMPHGGRLTITLEGLTFLHPSEAPLANMTPGPWVHIAVGDTGSGIRRRAAASSSRSSPPRRGARHRPGAGQIRHYQAARRRPAGAHPDGQRHDVRPLPARCRPTRGG